VIWVSSVRFSLSNRYIYIERERTICTVSISRGPHRLADTVARFGTLFGNDPVAIIGMKGEEAKAEARGRGVRWMSS
jgi:hypothetical protein